VPEVAKHFPAVFFDEKRAEDPEILLILIIKSIIG